MNICCTLETNPGKVSPESEEDETSSDADVSILKRNRKPTDIAFLIAFGLFVIVECALLGYCMHFGDIYRILNGYDNCGNVCGRDNTFNGLARPEIEDSGCHGINMTTHSYVRVQSWGIDSIDGDFQTNRVCVESCNNYSELKPILNRCIPDPLPNTQKYVSKTGIQNFFQEVAEDLYGSWTEILYMCLISFVLSIMTLLMFRYLAAAIVWIVLIGLIAAFAIATTVLWIHYQTAAQDLYSENQAKMFLGVAIASTIITVILPLTVIFLRKRIKLVIVLFKEAGKAAASMPLILFEPILTFIAMSSVIALWMYFALWIESSGKLVMQDNANALYVKDDQMKVTRCYNLMALFWTVQFFIGCQHMVIAGAVAIWYFSRNKNDIQSPIAISFKNMIKFHLGTVALGSFLISFIQMLRTVLRGSDRSSSESSQCETATCDCCLGGCQSYLQYINRNAYIETAIYGDSFFTAGSKAYHKLMSNTLRVFTINTIGDTVLFLGKVFVVVITIMTGMEMLRAKEGLHHIWVPLSLASIFAYIIASVFITVYEMIIDTIFLCFCEDCEMNDGLSRPYYMSMGLMDFVHNSKKVLGIRDSA